MIPSGIHSNELLIMVSCTWNDASNCNTTVHLDSWHPGTHLGTLPILVSPPPTWLHPKILANMQISECNPPKWTTKFMVSRARNDASNCNTTVHLDSWHPVTHLGTLPTLISPHPTWLQPKRPCINAELWVESTQMNYQLWYPGHETMIVTAILLFIWIVGILPHIWVPFLYSYHLLLLAFTPRLLAYMQICEWNPPKWTTNLWCRGPEKMIVTATLLFIWIVGFKPHFWVAIQYFYH